MNAKLLREIREHASALETWARRQIEQTRLDDAVLKCALGHCDGLEKINRDEARTAGLWGAPLPQARYHCPACQAQAGHQPPFASAAALFVHLMQCEAYRAEITPDFMRPMGAADPVKSADRDLVGVVDFALRINGISVVPKRADSEVEIPKAVEP